VSLNGSIAEHPGASGVGGEVAPYRAAALGDVADEVLRVAQETDGSVIVIGMRKRSPVGTLLMGSLPSGSCSTPIGRCSRSSRDLLNSTEQPCTRC
jgi:hypothetical protein